MNRNISPNKCKKMRNFEDLTSAEQRRVIAKMKTLMEEAGILTGPVTAEAQRVELPLLNAAELIADIEAMLR